MFDLALQNFWRKVISQASHDACETRTINRLQKKLDDHNKSTYYSYEKYFTEDEEILRAEAIHEKIKARLQLELNVAIAERDEAIAWLHSEDFLIAAFVANYCAHAVLRGVKIKMQRKKERDKAREEAKKKAKTNR